MKTLIKVVVCLLLTIHGNLLEAQDKVRSEAPLNPEFIQYQQNLLSTQGNVQDGHSMGYIPSPLQYHFGEPSLKKATEVTFDAVYDLRALGLLTEVRDQGICGSCWTFAAYGSLESNWLKNGYGSFDLSENNMKNCHGFVPEPCKWGNRDMATAYLTRFSGPVNETVDPYSADPGTCTSYIPDYYVSNVVFLPKVKDILKQAILDYGALGSNMRYEDASFNETNNTHYYSGTSTLTNHGVTIVGWDDNKVTASSNPGAWIVKNNWGNDWGDNGYFYVSYDDVLINTSPYYLPGRIFANSSSALYSIDKLGPIGSTGYGISTAYALIKYTAINNYPLLKVGTYTVASNSIISVDVYDTFIESTGTLSGLLGTISTQTCTFPGYYTFSLPSPIPMTPGNDFFIKISYNTPGMNYPIPVETQVDNYAVPDIESGVCWTSYDGGDGVNSWDPVGNNVPGYEWDLCIKVFAGVGKVWTGSSTSWNDPDGWSPSGIPGSNDDVLIPFVAANQPSISSTSVADCRSLYNEGTITVNSDGSSTGSLIVSGKAYGGGNVKFNRQIRTQANYGDYHYFSSPVVETVSDFTTANSSKLSQIWEWQESNATPWQTVASGAIVSGRGYNLAQKTGSDGLFVFTGSIVNSAGPVTATAPYSNTTTYIDERTAGGGSWGGGGCNLLGNPFPSSMNGAKFVTNNSASFDPNCVAIYIYDGVNNIYRFIGTDAVSPYQNATTSFGTYIQAGQGFFVLAGNRSVPFSFASDLREHNTGTELKSATAGILWPGLDLLVKNGDNINFTTIVYNEKMTTGLDPGYDVGQLSANPEVEIYTALVKDNGVNFARQALPLLGSDKNIIPVGVDAVNGTTVTFSAKTVPIENGTFYLEDRTLGSFTDLSKDSYTVTLPEKTAGTGRFYIHTSMTTGIQPILAKSELGVRIWNVNNRVNIEGAVSSKATGAIYDLLGRQLLQTRLSDSNFNTITVPTSVKGIYMVKVVDGEKVATRKVVF